MKKVLKLLALLPIVPVLASAPSAFAATATANFPVNANVGNNCTITANPLNFGNYDPLSANATSGSTTVTITCTKGATTTIGLSKGGGSTVRRMVNAANNELNYELYKPDSNNTTCPSAPTSVWGNSGAELLTPVAAPSKDPRAFTVCGRITAGQDVPQGTYADTVTATVDF